MKKIFLTGAAGFIGFHLAQSLVKRGDQVVGFDNFNNYYQPDLKRERAKRLKDIGVETIEGDLCETEKLKQIFASHNFTHVVHLAAQAGVRYSLTNPQAYVSSNIQGFVSLLEVCKDKPCPFIFASSSSVYGSNEKIPFSIKDSTDSPVNLYGATKKANELIARSYHHLYKIPMTGLRFFTVYGPWGRPDMAYYSFTKSIIEGTPVRLFNKGNMKRDFTYIDDIIKGTVAAIDLGADWEIFNLGNNRPEELTTFISILENAIGKKAEIIHEPMQLGDMESTYADISESQSKLNFNPTVALHVGLPKFVNWYLSYHQVGSHT